MIVFIFGAAGLSLLFLQQEPSVTHEVAIVLTDRGFEPQELTIQEGTMVTFSTTLDRPYWPASDAHPSHTNYPEFDPRHALSPQESWSFTFNNAGIWNFHDHLRSYFSGTVRVTSK